MTPRVIGGDGGFVYLPASTGGGGSISFDFTTGSLPGAITFTRASTGTYNSSGNILTSAGINAARFNYVGGVACLLVEPAATNLLLQSNNFASGADWFGFTGAVITAAQFISPDGTNDGWSVTAGSGFGGLQSPVAVSAIAYTISVWSKRISATAPLTFQLNSTVSAQLTTSATLTRYVATLTPGAGSNAYFYVAAATGTNGFFGAQLETGSVATSYIPTTTAAVTRAVDSATFTIPAGVTQLTYTFDDNSTQVVAVSAGSYTIPVTLNRPNIKSIVGA